ncbi:MAG: hypothetical protein WCX79_00290 [Candidatus Paceibacterota bacterium]|jgi:hypothetical protein
MKTRLGFVSNSSSSSFLIAGIIIGEIPKEFEDDYDWLEHMQKKHAELKDFEKHCPFDDCGYYIGISYDKIEMDETRRQFLQRAQTGCDIICNNFKIKPHAVETLEASWRNG